MWNLQYENDLLNAVAIESEDDIFNVREAVDYIIRKVRETGNPLPARALQVYIDRNEIEAIYFDQLSFFKRRALDEFIQRYTAKRVDQPWQILKGIRSGTRI